MNGIINMLKPPGMSSHDIVYVVRKALMMRKVGHTGTLDPEAAGVLPICLGKATKTVDYLTDKVKKYRAIVKLGLVTDTYDIYGKTLLEEDLVEVSEGEFLKALGSFMGIIEQMPPIYSAIKVNGKKLYQYALDNEEVEIKSRKVEIYSIDFVKKCSKTEFMIDITCSKGTYIRSLCYDIGQKLGVGACMGQLIRISTSPFHINDAITIEELKAYAANDTIKNYVTSIETIFYDMEKIQIKQTAYVAFINGNMVFAQGFLQKDAIEKIEIGTTLCVYCNGDFLGTAMVRIEEKTGRKNLKLLHNFSD